MDYAIDQIKDTISILDKKLEENRNDLDLLQSSVSQLSTLSTEISDYISQVFNGIKEAEGENSLQISVSALLEIKRYLSQKPVSVSNTISSLTASQQIMLQWRQREESVISAIEARQEKIKGLKEELIEEGDIKRKTGDRPEKLKDIRDAKSELDSEE